MVKRNPDNDSLHAKSLILEDADKQAIEDAMSNSPVQIKERKISNPMNDLEGLYIQIASTNRDDLFEDVTMQSLKEAANKVGYNGNRMDRGNFPSKKESTRYDDFDGTYYTLAVWFKHRI